MISLADALDFPKCTTWTKVVIGLVMLALILPAHHGSDALAVLALAYLLSLVTSAPEQRAVSWVAMAATFIIEARDPHALVQWSWAVTAIDWIRLGSWILR